MAASPNSSPRKGAVPRPRNFTSSPPRGAGASQRLSAARLPWASPRLARGASASPIPARSAAARPGDGGAVSKLRPDSRSTTRKALPSTSKPDSRIAGNAGWESARTVAAQCAKRERATSSPAAERGCTSLMTTGRPLAASTAAITVVAGVDSRIFSRR